MATKRKHPKGYVDVPKYTRLEVEWIDASGSAGWVDDDRDFEPPIIVNIGYLIRSNVHGLILATGIYIGSDGKPSGSDRMLAPSFIPHGMVRKIRRVK